MCYAGRSGRYCWLCSRWSEVSAWYWWSSFPLIPTGWEAFWWWLRISVLEWLRCARTCMQVRTHVHSACFQSIHPFCVLGLGSFLMGKSKVCLGRTLEWLKSTPVTSSTSCVSPSFMPSISPKGDCLRLFGTAGFGIFLMVALSINLEWKRCTRTHTLPFSLTDVDGVHPFWVRRNRKALDRLVEF